MNTVACNRTGQSLAVSGSDDGDIKLWDPRVRGSVQTLAESYQVTAVEFSQDGSQVFPSLLALFTAAGAGAPVLQLLSKRRSSRSIAVKVSFLNDASCGVTVLAHTCTHVLSGVFGRPR